MDHVEDVLGRSVQDPFMERTVTAAMTEIHIKDDFALDKIARIGQCFRWHRAEENAWRIVHGTKCLTIREFGCGK